MIRAAVETPTIILMRLRWLALSFYWSQKILAWSIPASMSGWVEWTSSWSSTTSRSPGRQLSYHSRVERGFVAVIASICFMVGAPVWYLSRDSGGVAHAVAEALCALGSVAALVWVVATAVVIGIREGRRDSRG